MLTSTFGVVLPVFVLIGGGWAAARLGRISDDVVDALMAFVIRFAVPTLLFANLHDLDLSLAFNLGALAAFYIGALVSFAAGVLIARLAGRRPGEQVSVGFCAFFSNTLLLGVPIVERAYGAAALGPAFGLIAFHAPVLYTFGIVAMEVSRRDGTGARAALKRAWTSISSNALMIGIALGVAFNVIATGVFGVRLPAPVAEAVDLLAQSGPPTALFAIGAALTRYALRDDLALAAGVAAIATLLHPLVAWLIADQLLGLDAVFVRAATVIAAMPCGMNVYVFAAMYHRAEGAASSALLLSTAASIVTISFWLEVLGGVDPATSLTGG